MEFGKAIQHLRDGHRVRRSSWIEKKKFVFMQIPSQINKEIVPKMQSLPQLVKDYFQRTFDDPNEQIASISYSNQLAIVHSSNLITGYSPSADDSLAIDWIVLD